MSFLIFLGIRKHILEIFISGYAYLDIEIEALTAQIEVLFIFNSFLIREYIYKYSSSIIYLTEQLSYYNISFR